MFDFKEYYKVSKNIELDTKLSAQESYRRTAVSRAYYSAYKISDIFLKDNYPTIYSGSKGKGGHQVVWNLFGIVDDLKGLGIQNRGLRLLEKRKKADYNSNDVVNKLDMRLSNNEAEEILKKIKEDPSES